MTVLVVHGAGVHREPFNTNPMGVNPIYRFRLAPRTYDVSHPHVAPQRVRGA